MPPKVNLQVKLRAVELYGKEKNIVNVKKIINGEFNLTIRRWLINKNLDLEISNTQKIETT